MVRTASVFAVIIAAFIVGTWPILEKIGSRWFQFDEAYSHGLMIFGLSVYLIFRAWRERQPVAGFYPIWLVPLAALIAIYVVAALLYIEAIQQFLLVPLLLVAVAVTYGFSTMWRMLLPIGILIFALPFWDYSAYPLQLITTNINELLLGAWGIEFEVEGILVFLPGIGAFEIAHGCSGLRYLLVAMSLATVYSELNYSLWRNRITLFAVAVFLALLTNWIRVFVIIYMGYQTEMQSSLIEDHEFFGWVLFATALVPLFIVAAKLERNAIQAPKQSPLNRDPATVGSGSSTQATLAVLVVGLFLISPLSVYAVRQTGHATQDFSISLEGIEGWSPLFQRMPDLWQPDYAGADHHSRKAWFETSGERNEEMPRAYSAAHVLTYETQFPGKELIRDNNRIVDTRVWQPKGHFTVDVNGETLSGMNLENRQSGDSGVVVYGFYVSGSWASEPLGAKFLQLYSAINSRKDASLIAISVHCDDCNPKDEARAWAGTVMAQAQKALDVRFSKTRQ